MKRSFLALSVTLLLVLAMNPAAAGIQKRKPQRPARNERVFVLTPVYVKKSVSPEQSIPPATHIECKCGSTTVWCLKGEDCAECCKFYNCWKAGNPGCFASSVRRKARK